MESLDSLLCAEGSESLKSLCLKLLLCLVTVSDPSICFSIKGIIESRGKLIWIFEPLVRKREKKKISARASYHSRACEYVEGSELNGLSLPGSCSLEQLLAFLACRVHDIYPFRGTIPWDFLSSGLSDLPFSPALIWRQFWWFYFYLFWFWYNWKLACTFCGRRAGCCS